MDKFIKEYKTNVKLSQDDWDTLVVMQEILEV
jgi:hypothetical protein